MPNGLEPFVGDFNGDAHRHDIFWYGPGDTADGLWFGRLGGAFPSTSRWVAGTYRPLVGDFDGNGLGGMFWYGPGSAPDGLWVAGPSGTFQSRSLTVNGHCESSGRRHLESPAYNQLAVATR